MYDISSSRITHCAVHRIGNRLREEGCKLSSQEVRGTAELHGALLRGYLSPLVKSGQEFSFYHESDISLNAISSFARKVFDRPENFLDLSQSIAKHLYSASTHPSIPNGEFIAILFQDVRKDQKSSLALGLYKIEQREVFLDIEAKNDSLNLVELNGISLNNIQKGVLIVDDDLKLFVKESGGQHTKYWVEDFLKARPRQTNSSTTKVVAEFVKQVCSRIDFESGVSLRRDLVDIFSAGDSVRYKDISEATERYLEKDQVAQLTQQLEDRSGFSIVESEMECELLGKQTKNILHQYPLTDGITLSISNARVRMENFSLIKTKNGYRAVIDIISEGN